MDTLQLVVDSISRSIIISSNGLNNQTANSQDILDYVYKISVAIIALLNFCFSIYLFFNNKENQKNKEFKENRQRLLNVLVLEHKLDKFYDIFSSFQNECKILLNPSNQGDNRKDVLNEKLEDLFINLNLVFITPLRAIDVQLSTDILNIADSLQEQLSKNIFDNGVNLDVEDKYNQLIKEPISNAEISIVKKLYDYNTSHNLDNSKENNKEKKQV